jgi:hypothetical protein
MDEARMRHGLERPPLNPLLRRGLQTLIAYRKLHVFKSKPKFHTILTDSMIVYDLSEFKVPSLGGDLGEASKKKKSVSMWRHS